MTVQAAAAVLQYEDWDPLLVLTSNTRALMMVFDGRKELAKTSLLFYEKIVGLREDEKLRIAKKQVFYHPSQQESYLLHLSPGFLKDIMTEICRMFGWPLPRILLIPTLPLEISRVAKVLSEGKTSVEMAVKRLELVGRDESLRPRILQALSGYSLGAKILRHRLSELWNMPGPRSAPFPNRLRCNPRDRFHTCGSDDQFLRTADDLAHVLETVVRPAEKILLAWHYSNDLRGPPGTIAILSFRAVNSVTTFHFFIIGEDSLPKSAIRDFLRVLVDKPIFVPGAEAISVLFRFALGMNPRHLKSLHVEAKKRGKYSAMETAARVVFQQSHCPVHFDDLVSSFADCTPSLFRHLSTGLFVLEWFPWEESASGVDP